MEKADIESAELMIEAKFDQDDDPSSSRRFPPGLRVMRESDRGVWLVTSD